MERNLGKPTFFLDRLPLLESDQFLRATHRSTMPVAYASFEFSSHHGAMAWFSALNCLRMA